VYTDVTSLSGRQDKKGKRGGVWRPPFGGRQSLLDHWWKRVTTPNVALSLNNLIDAPRIYVKQRSNPVLILSLSKELPHLDGVIKCQSSARSFAFFHMAIPKE
jgi:hypothetical protein